MQFSNRLIRQETVDIDGEVVVQYIYTLGVAGERKSVTELNRTVEYSYDSLYRLTSETITEGDSTTVYTYAYDNVSNRILKTENGAETAYVYNALNQLVSDSETSYEYDLNGNLVRVIGSANSALYEYNSENKLIKATVQSGDIVVEETYTYDYAGNRTSKTTHRSDGNTEFVKYLNDTNSDLTNVLCEIDENGTVKCAYTLGADLISQERDGDVSVYLYDGHGSVVGLANESGVVTDTYSYDAFGNLLDSTGSTANCYRYCGEQFDETTGLYYLRARYMDTTTGRFITQDTYQGTINDPVSLHKYLYCGTNPVMYSDASGYSERLDSVLIATAGVAELNAIIVSNYSAVLHDILVVIAVIVTGAFLYLVYELATVIAANQIADGSTNSAEANQETRNSAIDDALKDSGTGGGGNPNNNKNNKKNKKNKYSHLDIKEICRRFNITKNQWHRIIKPAILKMISDKTVGGNPDVYFDRNGFIQVVSRLNNNIEELGISIYELIQKLLTKS